MAYPDHERPLSPTGRNDAAAAGSWIRQTLPRVDEVVCSTAERTRQTLEALRVDAPTRFAEDIYGGGVPDILDQIALTPEGTSTLLVVGHAPGIPAVAYELASVARISKEGAGSAPADDQDDPDEPADLAALRHFSACALAVLQTDGAWNQLAETGAELVSVRHPRS